MTIIKLNESQFFENYKEFRYQQKKIKLKAHFDEKWQTFEDERLYEFHRNWKFPKIVQDLKN